MLDSFDAALTREARDHEIARLRGRVLARLLAVLKEVDASWSIPRLARLVLASSTDFVEPPCPCLCKIYEDADPKALAETLKKAIASGKKRA
jgi:hypothetical protein